MPAQAPAVSSTKLSPPPSLDRRAASDVVASSRVRFLRADVNAQTGSPLVPNPPHAYSPAHYPPSSLHPPSKSFFASSTTTAPLQSKFASSALRTARIDAMMESLLVQFCQVADLVAEDCAVGTGRPFEPLSSAAPLLGRNVAASEASLGKADILSPYLAKIAAAAANNCPLHQPLVSTSVHPTSLEALRINWGQFTHVPHAILERIASDCFMASDLYRLSARLCTDPLDDEDWRPQENYQFCPSDDGFSFNRTPSRNSGKRISFTDWNSAMIVYAIIRDCFRPGIGSLISAFTQEVTLLQYDVPWDPYARNYAMAVFAARLSRASSFPARLSRASSFPASSWGKTDHDIMRKCVTLPMLRRSFAQQAPCSPPSSKPPKTASAPPNPAAPSLPRRSQSVRPCYAWNAGEKCLKDPCSYKHVCRDCRQADAAHAAGLPECPRTIST